VPGVPLGLDRLPGAVRGLLIESSANAARAAHVLSQALSKHSVAAAIGELAQMEEDGDRITHGLRGTLTSLRVMDAHRRLLLTAAEVLDDIVDHAEALGCAAASAPRPSALADLGSILRDICRQIARACTALEVSPQDAERAFERGREYLAEARPLLRRTRALTMAEYEPVLALRQLAALEAAETAVAACRRALPHLERLSSRAA
jgi:hypothetical protein